jgi:hypothetical protein
MAKPKKSSKKLKRVIGIVRRKLSARILFVLIFALLGVAGLLYSRAATQPSVRFVLFCATDKCSGSVDAIDRRVNYSQGWFQKQLGNSHTFRKLPTKKITGIKSAYWYSHHYPSGATSKSADWKNTRTQNTYYNLYYYQPNLKEDNVKTIR